MNFAALHKEKPELSRAINQLDGWLSRNPRIRAFEPRRVAEDADPSVRLQLLDLFTWMVTHGYLRRVFRIRPPYTGTLLSDCFEALSDIPEQMRDSMGNTFDRDDAEIVVALLENST